MAYSEKLAENVRAALAGHKGLSERKMFGGLCLLLRGHMTCGIVADKLMLRVGPAQYEKTLAMKHVTKMDFTGRPMKGMVYVRPEGLKTKSAVKKWVDLAAAFTLTLPRK